MSFWSTQEILRRHKLLASSDGGGLVSGGSGSAEDMVKEAAWQLTLGGQVFVTASLEETRRTLDKDEQVVIPPGQFGLLLTEEKIALPKDAIGFISMRTPKKMRGLVNVSGFHVDPGFCGRLVFAVYNAGSNPIVLQRGERLFLLWFADLMHDGKPEEDSKPFNREKSRWNQSGIGSDDVMNIIGEIASPAHLKKQLDTLQASYKTFRAIVVTFAVALLGAYARIIVPASCGSAGNAPGGAESTSTSSRDASAEVAGDSGGTILSGQPDLGGADGGKVGDH